MIPAVRQAYNAAFTTEKYQAMLADVEARLPGQLEFRLAETPIFVPAALRDKLIQAGQDIIRVIQRPDFKELTEAAIPAKQRVPNEDAHPTFLTFDFAICRDAQGELEPQLIEMQGFPSLYAFQTWQPGSYARQFEIPDSVTPYFEVSNHAEYEAEMRQVLLGDAQPEEVILLELFPEKQKTRIDFALTKQFWGIEAVCLTKIRKRGRQLFYEKDGREIQIKRIYNRIIFDELDRYPDLQTEYHLTDDVEMTWVGHPNWFFRISKFTLPLIDSQYSPPSYYLQDLTTYPADLENYVLKPLFSFAGAGVRLHITAADLDALPDKHNYLLQRKVTYEPVIETPVGGVKCEIRLLYVWHPGAAQPRLLTGLGRMSRGEMIGVAFNKDKDWVGGTAPLFEKG
ncbi:hypothetical protein Q5H93_15175 [Hymenobacter sp. ASUV-10]|uniref:Circularly permuted type 2 ATP-grasp protein n=1 Tax=Hymenobacter aranciens TaxID=3063996 RepID=A0ABT9BE82_9BACT|nr:hypothetical protein [Hymenobacter sp. ASUV-10]MDO7876085.1 hypothetical protein [Hymenobacter sp. ASUV-10]